jgi:hypothetical protein
MPMGEANLIKSKYPLLYLVDNNLEGGIGHLVKANWPQLSKLSIYIQYLEICSMEIVGCE